MSRSTLSSRLFHVPSCPRVLSPTIGLLFMSMLGCGAESGSDNLDALPQEAESGIGSAASALMQVAKEESLRPTSPTKVRTSPAPTEGRYLVSLVGTTSGSSAEASGLQLAQLASKYRVTTQSVFHHALKGFSATLSAEQVEQLRADPSVAQIEPVRPVHADAVQVLDPAGEPWGLDRIDRRELLLDKRYRYDFNGSGIRAYVIDTGLEDSHPEFGGRAMRMFDAFGGDGRDENGHGTHVAGTIGSVRYGVAKNVLLRGVKVLDRSGQGTNETVIQGIEWVARNGIRPAVVNISIGGDKSMLLNQAIDRLSASTGMLVVTSAGNEHTDACTQSPASASSALAVAATNKGDQQASFSNFGACVGLYAPGERIRSTGLQGTTMELSGTSMAAPHVTGTAALFKSMYGDLPYGALKQKILQAATPGVVKLATAATPNRLLYQGLVKAGP